jgi:hypothetical protein
VTIAESPEVGVREVDGMRFSSVAENAYEYTVLLDIVRRDVACDLVFLIHDTCHVGPKFGPLARRQPGRIGIEYMSVQQAGLFNMGWYRMDFLKRIGAVLESFVGMSKVRAIDIEMNRTGEGFRAIGKVIGNFLDARERICGPQTPYDPKVIRNERYLYGADIHKFFGDPPGMFQVVAVAGVGKTLNDEC